MKTYSNRNGFTLLEVVAILVILGIITALAISQLSSSQNNLIAATDTLTSHLRLAQARAMNTSAATVSVWGVNFTSPTQYYLFYGATASTCVPAASKVAFPGAGSVDITPTGGVQVTNSTPLIVAFDRFGTPYPAATLTTPLAAQLTITLKDNNNKTRTINITPQTGMIKS